MYIEGDGYMNKKIGVYLNKDGETIAINESGVIRVYCKEEGQWGISKVVELDMSTVNGMQALRVKFKELASSLEDCRVIVGRNITGIPYTVLDSMGFNLWEIEGKPEEFLEYVLEKELIEEQEKNEEVEEITAPIETDKPGCFHINLKKLQENKSKLSSKQVLMPFLQSSKFYELEIICDHMPPWFENEFERLYLKYFSVKSDSGEYKVKVYHKTCNEE
jgi:Fe-only nitrogenase accessory protein AnfO